jgi:hypothetical protein
LAEWLDLKIPDLEETVYNILIQLIYDENYENICNFIFRNSKHINIIDVMLFRKITIVKFVQTAALSGMSVPRFWIQA